MDDLNDQLDVISERLITLDGSPYSTLREMADNTQIPDEIGNWDRTIPERLATLVEGYRYLADLYQKGLKSVVKKAMIQHKISLSASKQILKNVSG